MVSLHEMKINDHLGGVGPVFSSVTLCETANGLILTIRCQYQMVYQASSSWTASVSSWTASVTYVRGPTPVGRLRVSVTIRTRRTQPWIGYCRVPRYRLVVTMADRLPRCRYTTRCERFVYRSADLAAPPTCDGWCALHGTCHLSIQKEDSLGRNDTPLDVRSPPTGGPTRSDVWLHVAPVHPGRTPAGHGSVVQTRD